MGTECFTEQDSQVKQSAWNSRDSIKLKVKTAIIYWVPLCTEYWCLVCMIKLINSLHFSGTHQNKQWVDIIFQSSQYSSFTDEDKRLDSQPCQQSSTDQGLRQGTPWFPNWLLPWVSPEPVLPPFVTFRKLLHPQEPPPPYTTPCHLLCSQSSHKG